MACGWHGTLQVEEQGQRQAIRGDRPLLEAVYAEADQTLKDCMDIATATSMCLSDARNVTMPAGDTLALKARKTGKTADYDVSVSSVLPELIARRRKLKANHLMLLSTPIGRPVSETMLRFRWDAARSCRGES